MIGCELEIKEFNGMKANLFMDFEMTAVTDI